MLRWTRRWDAPLLWPAWVRRVHNPPSRPLDTKPQQDIDRVIKVTALHIREPISLSGSSSWNKMGRLRFLLEIFFQLILKNFEVWFCLRSCGFGSEDVGPPKWTTSRKKIGHTLRPTTQQHHNHTPRKKRRPKGSLGDWQHQKLLRILGRATRSSPKILWTWCQRFAALWRRPWTRFADLRFVDTIENPQTVVCCNGVPHTLHQRQCIHVFTLYTCFYILYLQYIYVLGGGFTYFFTRIWGRFLFWLVCFKRVETTNICIMYNKNKARPPFCKSLATITTFVVGTSYKWSSLYS